MRWVKKKTGPPAADIADKAALTAAEKDAEVIVLGYFTETKVGGLLRGRLLSGGPDSYTCSLAVAPMPTCLGHMVA